jgi:hypothetical protein
MATANADEFLAFQDVRVIEATAQALLCGIRNKRVWLPRLHVSGRLRSAGDRGRLLIRRWIARDRGLIEPRGVDAVPGRALGILPRRRRGRLQMLHGARQTPPSAVITAHGFEAVSGGPRIGLSTPDLERADASLLEPHRRLMLAVLKTVVDDCRSLASHPGQRNEGPTDRRRIRRALAYVTSRDRAWPFSYENLCDTLGLNAAALRDELQRKPGP